jgi:hypothetical protein
LNLLISQRKGIFKNPEKEFEESPKQIKKNKISIKEDTVGALMRSMTTINEEKDKKGLLRPLTYKEKYLMYYNLAP